MPSIIASCNPFIKVDYFLFVHFTFTPNFYLFLFFFSFPNGTNRAINFYFANWWLFKLFFYSLNNVFLKRGGEGGIYSWRCFYWKLNNRVFETILTHFASICDVTQCNGIKRSCSSSITHLRQVFCFQLQHETWSKMCECDTGKCVAKYQWRQWCGSAMSRWKSCGKHERKVSQEKIGKFNNIKRGRERGKVESCRRLLMPTLKIALFVVAVAWRCFFVPQTT